jgi:hypothetical protein
MFQASHAGQQLWLTQSGLVFDFEQCKSAAVVHSRDAVTSKVPGKPIDNQVKARNAECDRVRYVIDQDLLGSNKNPVIETKGTQPGVRNYLGGSDPAKWQTQVHGFSEVVYHDVWSGIDLRLYGKGPDLEQEFIINPGADATQVKLAYKGVDRIKVANDGSLVVKTSAGQMRETSPRIYQEISGRRVPVKGHFKLLSSTSYTFELSAYDKRQPLVIDPTLLYSTFLGGSAGNNIFTIGTRESATGIAVDQSGNAYVTGFTQSPDFPTTPGAFQTNDPGGQQTFITKLNPSGSALVHSTYLNASFPTLIAVDAAGNAYVSGSNIHAGFPVTANAYSPVCDATAGGASFFTVLNPSGNGLVYSTCIGTFVGGVPVFTAMTADATGHVFIAGTGGNIPTTPNAYQPVYPGSLGSAFVMEFDTTLSGPGSLVYSTYLGIPGNADGVHQGTQARAIAVDMFGKIYLAGDADFGFPVTNGAFQISHAPCVPNGTACSFSTTSFVAKLDPSVSGQQSLIYATYFGGMGVTRTNAMAVDVSGNAYIAGITQNTLPTTPGAFQSTPPFGTPGAGSGSSVGFITKLNAGGSQLVYSTYLANACIPRVACFGQNVTINGIALDRLGSAYVTGSAGVNGVPVTPDAFQSTVSKTGGGSILAFVSKLDPTGTSLVYSSLLSGADDDSATAIAIDQIGDAYVAGHTSLSSNQALSVSSLTPAVGGNSGTVSPQIFGTGFHAGATAQLNCGSVVSGTNLAVGQGGRFLNTTFNLSGVPPSTCDVVITNPDGISASLPQAFTVQQGGATNIQLYLTGAEVRKVPAEVPLGPANAIVFATVTNTGNNDSSEILVIEPVSSPFSLTTVDPAGITGLADQVSDSDAIWDKHVAAGSSIVFALDATTNSSSPDIPLTANAYVMQDFQRQAYAFCLQQKACALCTFHQCDPGEVVAEGSACTDCGKASANCSDGTASCSQDIAACKHDLAKIPTGPDLDSACLHTVTNQISAILPLGQPADPNKLIGPPGSGSEQWMKGEQALSYLVSFENEPNATAPAQQVIVKQSLGPNVNLATLQLLGITLPNGASDIHVPVSPNSLNPSTGNNEFTTSVDLRPAQNLLVGVDAQLDPSTQILSWTFASIDPATGQPPLNPLVGFLPAGAGANLAFSVTPASGLPTGTQIAEQATITFQGADPLSTQVWTNSIDNTPPVSQVTALPASQPASGFTLTWTGTDVGSGVQDFTIFASDNGGPFTPFQTNTTATSVAFAGEVGHSYGFYSVARDLVGNIEAGKTTAEATTQIVLTTDSIAPATSALAAPTPNTFGWNNSNVTVMLNSADDPGGSGVKQINYSATGAQPIPNTTATGATTSFQVTAEGITNITFFGTDNAGNMESPKTLTIELDKTPPSITGSRAPLPNVNGWNNTNVTISFACADALSGLAAGSPPANTVITTEGANQSVPGTCQDLAGNIASTVVSGIRIDKTAPVISGMPAVGCALSETEKLVQIAVVSGGDTLSGLASFDVSVSSGQTGDDPNQPDIAVTGSGLQPRTVQVRAKTLKGAASRTYTVNATAMDLAGNAVNSSSTCTITKDH